MAQPHGHLRFDEVGRSAESVSYFAELVNVSHPAAMVVGDTGMLSVALINTGETGWKRGELWLERVTDADASLAVGAQGVTLDEDVEPGQVAYFTFELDAGDVEPGLYTEEFRLVGPANAVLDVSGPVMLANVVVHQTRDLDIDEMFSPESVHPHSH